MDLITGGDSTRPVLEAIGDTNRENIITNTLASPGMIESGAVGKALFSGLKAGAPGALNAIPGVAKVLGTAPVKAGVTGIESLLAKAPGVGEKAAMTIADASAPLASRAGTMAARGALTSMPAAAVGQVKNYSETGEVDPVEASIELAAGAVLDPTLGIGGKLVGKGLKNLSQSFFEKASGRSKDLLKIYWWKRTQRRG